MKKEPVLEIKSLTKTYPKEDGSFFYAARDVSFSLSEGESLGLVGESGCGKSTIARMITKLSDPTEGQIFLDGKEITHIPERQYKKDVFRNVQMVFQDPYGVFSPRMTIGTFLEEGLVYHGIMKRKDANAEAKRLLELVELPQAIMDRMPHQLSGGQQQRIAIARAISIKPKLLILDEATSALDVSVQIDVLKLLMRLQKELKLTYLFIGHDLAVVRSITDRMIVMYAGNVVEEINSENLLDNCKHPYTKKLLDSVFSVEDKGVKNIAIENLSLEEASRVAGCPFAHRCAMADENCRKQQPAKTFIETGHIVRCHKISE